MELLRRVPVNDATLSLADVVPRNNCVKRTLGVVHDGVGKHSSPLLLNDSFIYLEIYAAGFRFVLEEFQKLAAIVIDNRVIDLFYLLRFFNFVIFKWYFLHV